jgi:DNA-directed RNA polymerase alpha subunit
MGASCASQSDRTIIGPMIMTDNGFLQAFDDETGCATSRSPRNRLQRANLSDPIGKLPVSPRTKDALIEDGIETIRDLSSKTCLQLRYTPKIGPARLAEIVKALRDRGLDFEST